MNVLLISHAYPPFPASGSQRGENLAAAFIRNGHSVTVLTARLPGESARLLRTHGPDARVIPVGRVATPRHLYLTLRRRRVKKGADNNVGRGRQTTAAPLTEGLVEFPRSNWKRHFLSLLLLPDTEQGFILPAVFRGLRELRTGTNLLYTTGPPISTHLTGLLLKRVTKAPWVAEFRDPWVVDGVPLKPPGLRSRLADAIHRWLYHKCLNSADRIVAVTAGTAKVLTASIISSPHKVILARNGIPKMTPREAGGADESQTFRIVHLGELYGLRDPGPFFEAVATLKKEDHKGDLPPLRVDMVGHCEEGRAAAYQRMTVRLGIEALVHFWNWLPFEEGQDLLARADLLLLLAQHQPLQVPNKLYEYLGHRKPILAFADSDGETAAMLRTVGGHYLVTEHDDQEQTARTVRATIFGEAAGRLPGETDDTEGLLESWSTRAQLDHLLAHLGSLGLSTDGAS